MAKNSGLNTKTGIYIGEALITNPQHPVEKLNFKKCTLQEDGLIRILEACNANANIKSVNLGYISAKGLKSMAQLL